MIRCTGNVRDIKKFAWVHPNFQGDEYTHICIIMYMYYCVYIISSHRMPTTRDVLMALIMASGTSTAQLVEDISVRWTVWSWRVECHGL